MHLAGQQGSKWGSGASFELMTRRQRRAAARHCVNPSIMMYGKAFLPQQKRP